MNVITPIDQSFKILEEKDEIKKIERIARICYKSEENIKEGSDVKMVSSLIKNKHFAMIEHSSIAFDVSSYLYEGLLNLSKEFASAVNTSVTPERIYLRFSKDEDEKYIVSGNLRAWYNFLNHYYLSFKKIRRKEFGLNAIILLLYDRTKGLIDFKHLLVSLTLPSYYSIEYDATVIDDWSIYNNEERLIHETATVIFTVDRGISHEIVRHRPASYAHESTRYCNYTLGKFNGTLKVIKPKYFDEDSNNYKIWLNACENAYSSYCDLIEEGVKPEIARKVLPLGLASDLAVTATLDEWYSIFLLRACGSAGTPHPEIKDIMTKVLNEFIKKYGDTLFDLEI